MKLLKTLCSFAAVTFLLSTQGCIGEDMSDCPPEVNTQLTFSYMGDTDDPAMFGRSIDRVTLLVFDRTSGQHILTKTVGRADLRRFQGTELYLHAGDFRIISWGNAYDHTEIQYNSLSGGRVHAPEFGTVPQGVITTNDHLYYGDLFLTVPAAATLPGNNTVLITGDIPHRSAHINIEIYVKGFGREDDRATWPVIAMSGLMPQYDMDMQDAQPYSTTYYPEMTEWDSTTGTIATRFQTLRFADDNRIEITFSDPAQGNAVKATVDLEQYMADNGITVDGKNEATVSLLVEFTSLGVSITIPDWSNSNTEPDI